MFCNCDDDDDNVKCIMYAMGNVVQDAVHKESATLNLTRMWANAQPDGRPAKHRWRPLFNAAKFG